MDMTTAHILNYTTSAFYQQLADSFSDTRNAPWRGWQRACDEMGFNASETNRYRLIDVGCGNQRFERYLEQRYPMIAWRFTLIDNCKALVHQSEASGDARSSIESHTVTTQSQFYECDFVGVILEEGNPFSVFEEFDVGVLFGIMHHVPGYDARLRLLEQVLEHITVGGYVAVSFWEFAKHEDMRVKAERSTSRALEVLPLDASHLQEGDYLLGWQDTDGIYRYCHSFSDGEVQDLILSLQEKARAACIYYADGRTGDLNCYVILQRLR